MTLNQLEQWVKEAKKLGVTGDMELKIYHKDSKTMSGVIQPIKSLEFRSVQVYDSDSSEYRNKYVLIK